MEPCRAAPQCNGSNMSQQDYFAFHFPLADERRDWLLALLEDLPFEGFEETDTELLAFLPASSLTPALEAAVNDIAAQFELSWHTRLIPYTNWNAEWEASFQSVKVGSFAGVRAAFHPPMEDVRYELVIQPKMAFGTGHHATTWLMMQAMESLPWQGASVLDFGCGTGILAILAAQLGAAQVHGVDIEREAYENSLENMAINNTPELMIYEGELSAVPADLLFNIILANINRNVILQTLPSLYQKMLPGGHLLVSGILADDRDQVVEAAQQAGFVLLNEQGREQWMMIHFMVN